MYVVVLFGVQWSKGSPIRLFTRNNWRKCAKKSAQKCKIATRFRTLHSDSLLRMCYALGETSGKHIFSILVRTKIYIANAANPVFTATEYFYITVLPTVEENKNLSPSESSKHSRPVQWSRLSHYERSEREKGCSSFLVDDTPFCEAQTHDSSHRTH